MKTYLQIFKFNLSRYGTRAFISYFLLLIVTIYKIFYVGINGKVFDFDQIYIGLPLLLLFALTLITIPINLVFFLKDSLKFNLLLMIPDIRKKLLFFTGGVLIAVFFWSLFIMGISQWKGFLIYIFTFTWYISMLISMLIGFKFIYRSHKYFLIKVFMLFAIFWIPYSYSLYKDIRFLSIVILGYILFVVLVQLKNFVSLYQNYTEDAYSSKKSIRHNLESNFFKSLNSATKESSLKKLLNKIKSNKSRFSLIRLYQYSLFDFVSSRIMLVGVYILFEFGILILGIGELKIGSIISSIIILRLSFNYFSKLFKMNDKIDNLYMMSKLRRKEFEKDILLTTIWYYSRILTFVFFIGIIHLYKINTHPNSYYLLLPSVSVLLTFPIIYLMWLKNIKNKDYSSTDKKIIGVSK